jgi:outer membrane protein OmpA-like peptidoglycan-associated protein
MLVLLTCTLGFMQRASALSKTYIFFFEMGDADLSSRCKGIIQAAFSDWQNQGGPAQAQNLAAGRCVSMLLILGFAQDPNYPGGNDRISALRAASVQHYLTALGVPASRLKSYSYGEKHPLVQTSTPDAQNRRVEIQIK